MNSSPSTPVLNSSLWVLDTNVVLDLLVFDDAVTRPLLHALEAERVRCAVSDATLAELRRVLAYPVFALDEARQMQLFSRYLAWSTTLLGRACGGLPQERTPIPRGVKRVPNRMPRCEDPDDQKFLELAASAGAAVLVSKDHALIKLRHHCAPLFRVMTPADAARGLSAMPG